MFNKLYLQSWLERNFKRILTDIKTEKNNTSLFLKSCTCSRDQTEEISKYY